MPQLDRYLVFSETFWFVLCFTLAYIFVAHLLVHLIRGLRLRAALSTDELLTSFNLKLEKITLVFAPHLDKALVGLTSRLDLWLGLVEWRHQLQPSYETMAEESAVDLVLEGSEPWLRPIADLQLLETVTK